MKKKFGVIIFIFLLLSVAGIFSDTEITIYYTASLNGNLLGCDCKGVPTAGLSTTAAYLREVDPENSILIELGDFNDSRTDELLSNTIVRLYSELDYTVVSLGDQELGSGVDFFKEISKKLNFISNNIEIDGWELSPAPQIIERKGVKIGIAAVIDPDVFLFYPAELKRRIKVSDPEAAAKKALKLLNQKGSRYNILLYHGNLEAAKELFMEQSDWDSILTAHDQKLIEQYDGKRLLSSPGEQGNRVGQLKLSFRFGRLNSVSNEIRYFEYEEDPEDPGVLQAFEDYKKELIANLKNGKR